VIPPSRRNPVSVSVKQPAVDLLNSVTTRIVVLTLSVLLAVGLVANFGLAQRERAQLVAAKALAVTMTTELFAASVSAALDLGDEKDVAERMAPLRSNASLVYAAVWKSASSQPVGELGRRPPDAPAFEAPADAPRDDYLRVVRPVIGPSGETIGRVGVLVSLEAENRALRESRRRIALAALVAVAITSGMLVAVLQWGVVRRLQSLSKAALKLKSGQNVRLIARGKDEVAQLGATFNAMADAIIERERGLANALRRLQALLDNMGQAIVTFDARGRVLGDRSRQAEQLLGSALTEGSSIVSLLYPKGSDQIVETEAFSTWIEAAFESNGEDWSTIASLAPANVTINRESLGTEELDLEFRWVSGKDGPPCVMLIATDATQRRRLERVIVQKERDHSKTVAALRWLVSGGGQLFVRYLDNARLRLRTAVNTLAAPTGLTTEAIGRIFRDVHTVRAESRCFDLDSVDQYLMKVELQLAEVRSGAIQESQAISESQAVMAGWLDAASTALDEAERQFVHESPIGREVLDQMTVRRSDVDRLVQLTTGRGDEVAKLALAMTARPFGETVMTVVDAAPAWAERVGKNIKIEIAGAERRVPGRLAEGLPGILSHLVRNAIAHGIEPPFARVEAGKSSMGTIRITCEGEESGPSIHVQDDGAGLDVGSLGEGDTQRATRAALETAVTTCTRPSGLAGFGVGLDAVRSDLVRIDYDIELRQEPTQGTCVTLSPRRLGAMT
jgi:two-component system, chemotaxis family, sensor kinase CheA